MLKKVLANHSVAQPVEPPAKPDLMIAVDAEEVEAVDFPMDHAKCMTLFAATAASHVKFLFNPLWTRTANR